MILGIDEAGRGPVMGPLVLCGVWARSQRVMEELGVDDSKRFGSGPGAQQKRRALAEQIVAVADHVALLCAEPEEVDQRVRINELNRLEQELASRIIDSGPRAASIIADGARLFGPLKEPYPHLRAEDKADQQWPVVAAASIVAKAHRDRCFAELVAPHEEHFGPVRGGGYANRATTEFLRAYHAQHGRLPEGVRRSWSWPVLWELDPSLTPPGQQPLFED